MPKELSRWIAVRQADGRSVNVCAEDSERAVLAARFDLVAVNRLEATLVLTRDGDSVLAEGTLSADIVQLCAVSGEDLPVSIEEKLGFLFVPAGTALPDEIELEESDCDEIVYEGDRFDLGEAVAQSLALAIDPFAAGPDADAVRKDVGLQEPEHENPFAALKGLKPDG